jgi:hypothetical protein
MSGWWGLASAPPAPAATAYNSYSAGVQGVALRMVAQAVGAADDPGSAATIANINVFPGTQGQFIQLKGSAINTDPGTLAGAALFAAPDCTAFSDGNQSSGYPQCALAGGSPEVPPPGYFQDSSKPGQSPGKLPGTGTDSGLEVAAGFPGWAEAFYPQPDQRHVVKCAANKDAKDASSTCSPSQNAYYADARVNPDNTSAGGMAITASPQGTELTGSSVSSQSSIALDASNRLVSIVDSWGAGFAIPGVPGLLIRGYHSIAKTIADGDKVTAEASCTVDVNINGQAVDPSQATALINALPKSPNVAVHFEPPSPPIITQSSAGGKSAACTGAQLTATFPTTNQSGTIQNGTVRYILGQSFATSSQQSNAPTFDFGNSTGGVTGAGPGSVATGTASGGTPQLAGGGSPIGGLGSASAAAPALSGAGPSTSSRPGGTGGAAPASLVKPANGTALGMLAAGTVLAIALGGWLAVGVVQSLSKGTGLKLPGL